MARESTWLFRLKQARRSAVNVTKSAWTRISVINSEARMSNLKGCEVSTSCLKLGHSASSKARLQEKHTREEEKAHTFHGKSRAVEMVSD